MRAATTPVHELVVEPGIDALVDAAVRLCEHRTADTQLAVFVAEQDAPDLDALVVALRSALHGRSFFGGLFPAVIDGATTCTRGALLLALPSLGAPLVMTGGAPSSLQPPNDEAVLALVLVDGLCRNLTGFLEALYDQLGNTVAYWGGGAGTSDLQSKPCVFCNDGVFANAAIVALAPVAAKLGVRHGWTELVGPLVATQTRGNEILELNWESALEVYRAALARVDGRPIVPETFSEISASYPFGIQKHGAEFVVRDPIATGPNGSLICVGEVPENAVLAVLRGEPEALIEAAAAAATEACTLPCPARLILVADCVSRAAFLGDRFDEELAAMHTAASALSGELWQVGVLTLGEISSQGHAYLELFNKTAVVASVQIEADAYADGGT